MSSVKKNYIYNVGYQLLQFILPLLTAPYLARVLGAEGVGIYLFHSSCKFLISKLILQL